MIMAGVNRALADTYLRKLYEKEIIEGAVKKKCVYFSYRPEDIAAADAIAQYLSENDIDVFLQRNIIPDRNAKERISQMEDGMDTSTHLLILLPGEAELPWIVPYEIGYAHRSGKGIASVMLKGKGTCSFPEYLKEERVIQDIADFSKYAEELRKKSGVYYKLFEKPMTEPQGLYPYIKSFTYSPNC